jgi:ferredoxin-NADP reductase
LSEPEYHALAVAEVVDETADTRSFVLEVPPDLASRFGYAAGQFCTFRTTIDGEPVVRCYSMSSPPEGNAPLTVTVKRVPGGTMSNWMNDCLAPGDTIEVMPPAGNFVLRESAVPIVAFAGGSGITPILSIVRSALATTAREVHLVYANRDRDNVIFAGALERLCCEAGGRLSVHHHLDSEKGFLDAPACAELIGDRTDADFYVCGPGPYMDVVEDGLDLAGVAPERIHIERFELPEVAFASPVASETESMVIRIGGRKHRIGYEAGDTVLEAVRRAALKPPFSCSVGSCGTCMAFVAEGEARMRANNALDADEVEEGWILTCQAIPTSREIVIDYDR